ncbi:hypothetical protein GUR46_14430 [Stenotrophomonas maltophilia]|uniref:fimbrial protein n=1 Tax=Stenotrophomonas TaxID=40323 RepID=UPI00114D04EE|nr:MULTISPECIES: fimbrial protein [Stenotrophomonas]MCF3530085.1 hypothetical protein [Stenotrophomonas maltophilia]MCF3533969.1 hypothetical protein [Stenotrophomonas maltophilia]
MKSHVRKWARQGLLPMMAVVAMGIAAPAMARCDFGEPGRATLTGARLTVNGTQVGRPVSPWYNLSSVDDVGGCTDSGTMYVTGRATTQGSYTEGRSTYSIYETGVPGLGFIMAFRSEARENGIDYQPVVAGTTNSKVFFRHWLTLDLRIRFIKIGDIPEGTLVVPEVAAADFILRDFSSVTTGNRLLLGATSIEGIYRKLCYPRNTSVNMGRALQTEFSTRYSHSAPRTFDIVLDCEEKVGDVLFYLEENAASPLLDRDRGLVEVSGGAKGIALQMTDVGGAAIPFDSIRSFGHSGDAAGELRRTFQARYVQTVGDADDIVPGNANASISIVMAYP